MYLSSKRSLKSAIVYFQTRRLGLGFCLNVIFNSLGLGGLGALCIPFFAAVLTHFPPTCFLICWSKWLNPTSDLFFDTSLLWTHCLWHKAIGCHAFGAGCADHGSAVRKPPCCPFTSGIHAHGLTGVSCRCPAVALPCRIPHCCCCCFRRRVPCPLPLPCCHSLPHHLPVWVLQEVVVVAEVGCRPIADPSHRAE